MEVILMNKQTTEKVIVGNVYGFKRNKITSNGRKQWCYICYFEYYSITYPCSKYDIYTITERN